MNENRIETEKLRVLMDYWLNHNKEHIKENEKWLKKVRHAGFNDVAEQLEKVVELSKKVNHHIDHAIGLVDISKTALHQGTHDHISSHRHIELHQIGILRTPYTSQSHVPRQPVEGELGDFRIILNTEYVEGLYKLETFKYIYVLFYLNRESHDLSLRVTPPGSGVKSVGLFASRSPHRPSPVGLSIVQVKKIEGNVICTSGIDAFDNSVVIDIKPYMEKLDCKIGAGNGWIQD